jgi:Asp-tRNA(Asn)/Glu-tRNA(Gln) amidotransferase A subunit family amidase
MVEMVRSAGRFRTPIRIVYSQRALQPALTSFGLHWTPAWRLAELIASGEVSAREVCAAFLERIGRLDAQVNSFVTVLGEQAMATATALDDAYARGERDGGSLRGIPFSAKDNLFTAGVRTTLGSKLFETMVPTTDAGSVRRLRDAGAVLLGKANLPEFSSWRRSRNVLFGETVNPWDHTRSAGASSGGSGAAVGAGLVPISIGTDDGGSIRLPAALCGVYGLFPSPGRVPLDNTVVLGSVSQAGPLCRDVRDAATFLDAMSSDDGAVSLVDELERGIAGARIAWVDEAEGDVVRDRRVADSARAAAEALSQAGAHVDAPNTAWVNAMGAVPPVTPDTSAQFPGRRIYDLPEFHRAIAQPGWEQLLSPYWSPQRLLPGSPPDADTLERIAASRRAVVGQFDELFAAHDLICTPTIDSLPAPAWDAWTVGYGPPGAGDAEVIAAYVKYTLRVNVAGCVAASVPTGFVDGLPVGLQIIGRPGDEATVLRASRALEQLRPWADARPPGFA